MKRTSNNKLNYPGHIDCRNSSLTDKLEWESKSSVKWKAILRDARLTARSSVSRFNLNSDYLVKLIND